MYFMLSIILGDVYIILHLVKIIVLSLLVFSLRMTFFYQITNAIAFKNYFCLCSLNESVKIIKVFLVAPKFLVCCLL